MKMKREREIWWVAIFLILVSFFIKRPAIGGMLIDSNKMDLSISNTVRYEGYVVSGDKDSGYYPHTGNQPYDELNVNLSYKPSLYNSWRFEFAGLMNESDYRYEDKGLVAERWHIFNERGDVGLPYRLDLGDFYGFFSYRTLQMSLRGLQIELQPQQSRWNQSIMFLIGSSQYPWNHYQPQDDHTIGLSYLISPSSRSNLAFNIAYTKRKIEGNNANDNRRHLVLGINGLKKIDAFSQKLTLEGEVSFYDGDTDAEHSHDATGYFFQLNGKTEKLPLTYRLRFEDYGRYYTPPGSNVSADRRTYEVHLGWYFPKGVLLRTRWQLYQDQIHSDNHTNTNIWGMNLSGLIPVIKTNLGLDFFFEKRKNQDDSVDEYTYSTSTNFTKNITQTINGRLSASYNYNQTYTQDVSPNITKSIALGMDWTPHLSKGNLTVSPDAGIQQQRASKSLNNTFYTGFNLNFTMGRHSISSSARLQFQDLNPSEDVNNYTWNLNYQYTMKRDVIGFEFNSDFRRPVNTELSDSYKIGIFWTHYFEEHPSGKRGGRSISAQPEVALAGIMGQAPSMNFDLLKIPPGITLIMAQDILNRMGVKGGVSQGNFIIYETRLYEEIDQRQRLVLVTEGKIIKKSVVIINYEASGRIDDLKRTFEYIKQILVKSYGDPTTFYEKGDFGANLSELLQNKEFIRNYEWHFPEGSIRFGIPKRSDRAVRIEIHFGRDFPSIRESQWSLEQIL